MSGDVDGEGAQVAHRARRGRQHHQGDHQGHRDRDRGARRDRAVRRRSATRSARRPDAGQIGRRRRTALSLDVLNVANPTQPGRPAHRRGGGVPVLRPGDQRGVPRRPGAVVFEVRRQFREHPGIMDDTEKPEYGKVVDICTQDSLRELVTPGLLAVLAPIAVGFGLGVGALGAYLAGAIAHRHADGGLPGQLRWRLGQRQEARRGRPLRRQGLRGARGDGHRRHGRRPVQGHRRPGDQPADQGDEPGLAADRPGGRVASTSTRTPLALGHRARRVIVAVAVVVARRSIGRARERRRIADGERPATGTDARREHASARPRRRLRPRTATRPRSSGASPPEWPDGLHRRRSVLDLAGVPRGLHAAPPHACAAVRSPRGRDERCRSPRRDRWRATRFVAAAPSSARGGRATSPALPGSTTCSRARAARGTGGATLAAPSTSGRTAESDTDWYVRQRPRPRRRRVAAGEVAADHVLGVGGASMTLAQLTVRRAGRPRARPRHRLRGPGAAPGRHARTVVATDRNRRALRLAALTAALSGRDAWTCATGSLFEPVGAASGSTSSFATRRS